MVQDLAGSYALERVGIVMRPEAGLEWEAEGVLNPACAQGRDGELLLFPRVVARGNRSRITRARVVVADGVPVGVERGGLVLEAERGWEHGVEHGGVEDPRITWVEALGSWVMTYVAFGPLGPRGGIALSEDLVTWRRLGPIQFAYEDELDTDLNLFPNKDMLWFPEPVTGPDGSPCLAMLHRPMWEIWNQPYRPLGEDVDRNHPASLPGPVQARSMPKGSTDDRGAIWIGYVRLADAQADPAALLRPWGHRQVAAPEFAFEAFKLGGGPPPLRVPEGWLLLHHGVSGADPEQPYSHDLGHRYCAGAMLLDADDPTRVLARTSEPLLCPETDQERSGVVGNVVFPTAVAEVEGQYFVFYGMADEAIGVARLVRRDGAPMRVPSKRD